MLVPVILPGRELKRPKLLPTIECNTVTMAILSEICNMISVVYVQLDLHIYFVLIHIQRNPQTLFIWLTVPL